MIDPVQEFSKYRSDFMRERGAFKSGGVKKMPNGLLIMSPYTLIPKTTWADVLAFQPRYLAAMSNDAIEECYVKNGVSAGMSHEAEQVPIGVSLTCGMLFVEGSAYKKARDLWVNWGPVERFFASNGISIDSMVRLKALSSSGVLYPYNEEFWGYGSRFAIARSVAGSAPYPVTFYSGMAAVIDKLPAAYDKAKQILNAVTPRLPNFSFIGEMMKWGTIAGGAYLLYWLMKNRK